MMDSMLDQETTLILLTIRKSKNCEFSKGLMCLSIEWKLYTCRNSNREQLRKTFSQLFPVRISTCV